MYKNHKSYALILASLGLSLTLLSGCHDETEVQIMRDGYLIDAQVSGLHYEIRNASNNVLANGTTEADGRFVMRSEQIDENERAFIARRRNENLIVLFYLGDLEVATDRLILGSALVPGLSNRNTTTILTPIDLSVNEEVVVNIAQIIQSLDDHTTNTRRINIPQSAHLAVASTTTPILSSRPQLVSTNTVVTIPQLFGGSIVTSMTAIAEVTENWGCQFAGLYRNAAVIGAETSATTGTLFALKANAELDGYFYGTAPATSTTVQISGGLRFSDGGLIIYASDSSDTLIGGTSTSPTWVGARHLETKRFSKVGESLTPLLNINIAEIRTKSVLFPDWLITGAANNGTVLIELVVNGTEVSGYLIKADRSVQTISGTYTVATGVITAGDGEADVNRVYTANINLLSGNTNNYQLAELGYTETSGSGVTFDTTETFACRP